MISSKAPKKMTNHHLVIKKNCSTCEGKKFSIRKRKIGAQSDIAQFSYLRDEIEAINYFPSSSTMT